MRFKLFGLGFGICLLIATATLALPGVVTFESGQVRPLALSPDGSRLFVVDTPDNQLEIFAVNGGTPLRTVSVPVGLEPVAVAARSNDEVWVVNHLSDSISIVDVAANPPRVVRTLLVGDEPRDIVFAGSGGNRAFITTAHRGQHRTDPSLSGIPGAGDPQLTTEGIGRADVWVFDANNLGSSLGGTPINIVTLFGDTPRALAVTPDGSSVFAAVFNSGNQTTTVSEGAVCDGGQFASSCTVSGVTMPGGLPGPNTNFEGITQPEVGLIVKYNPTLSRWQDELGRNWNNAVKFNLPDFDVFQINANSNPPAEIASYPGVGTTLFNMAVNPVNGNIYVTNTDSRNEVRFEGPGVFGSTTVRSHLAEARVTVLVPGGTVDPRHLNKHINYSVVPSPAGTKDDSLATPVGIAVNASGTTVYVAAFGSSKIGVYDSAELEDDSFDPTTVTHIPLAGGGPTGLVLDETNQRLYALTRFNNSVAVVDTAGNQQVATLPLHNPEPKSVVDGRPFLYDAYLTSSNGEASCSSCHIFGDMDHLAWDLGNPDDIVKPIPNPFRVSQLPSPAIQSFNGFHPMKGPMTTQSLRGMANHGPMHWRGDRTGGETGGDPLDEVAAFNAFNVAFVGLLGRDSQLTDSQMQAFTDFILQVTYPPNPIRAIDNSLTADEAVGRDFFLDTAPKDIAQSCNGCHRLNVAQGFFGSDGQMSFENETQFMKIAHLRNLYQKVGMFGMPAVPFFNSGDNGNKGPQVRGFGFLHDGSTDTVFRFLRTVVFNQTQFGFPINPAGFPNGAAGNPLRRQVEAFMLAFDSNLAPIVGQQITLTDSNAATVGPRIDTLLARAAAGECDVVVKGAISDAARGWVRLTDGAFGGDTVNEAPLTDGELRDLASVPGQALTYTAVPPGSGRRIGIDRDGDGLGDRDELDLGSDPADAASLPAGYVLCPGGDTITRPKLTLRGIATAAADDRLSLRGEWVRAAGGDTPDPVTNGFRFGLVDNQSVGVLARTIPAGASVDGGPGWKVNSAGTKWTFRDRDGTLAGGVTKVTITDKSSRTPGLLQITISGRGDFALDPAGAPFRLAMVIGGGAQAAEGLCAERTLEAAGGAEPACTTSSDGNRLSCR